MAEGDGIGHLERQASGKGTDLLMDVHEEGVRLPAPHFANCLGANAIEVHGHCSTGSEGVAADIILGVAKIVQPNVSSCLLEVGVDVVSCDLTEGDTEWVVEIENASGGGSRVAKNVVYSASKGLDGAVDGASTFLMDTFTFDAILLVRHTDGSFSSREEHLK